jgi:hypothetical protein
MPSLTTPGMAATAKKRSFRLHIRLGLLVVGYVLCVNCAVRHYGADSFPLSVMRLPEKSWALVSLGLHSVKHIWSSDCADPEPFVREAAVAQGVPVLFALAIAKAESGFRSHSISSTGAMGVMQLMPRTARSLGVVDPFDPQDNARGAARFLSDLWTRYRGDRLRVAAAYNAGSGRVPSHGPMKVPSSTRGYAARVVRQDRQDRNERQDREIRATILLPPVLLTAR